MRRLSRSVTVSTRSTLELRESMLGGERALAAGCGQMTQLAGRSVPVLEAEEAAALADAQQRQ
jgi:hypothetical protein